MAAVFLILLCATIFALCALAGLRSLLDRSTASRSHMAWDVHDDQRRIVRNGFKSRIGAK